MSRKKNKIKLIKKSKLYFLKLNMCEITINFCKKEVKMYVIK